MLNNNLTCQDFGKQCAGGKNAISLVFCGDVEQFRPSFADLSSASRTIVIPRKPTVRAPPQTLRSVEGRPLTPPCQTFF